MTRSSTRQIAAMAIILATMPMSAFAQTSARDVETSTSIGSTARDARSPGVTDRGTAPAAADRSTATGGNPGARADKN